MAYTFPISAVEYTDWSTTRQSGRGGEQSKTQYKINYSYYESKTCYKTCYDQCDQTYTCNQSRNNNSCGCGINYSDPVVGYCNDVQIGSSIVKSCSASSGACPGGTKVRCYYQGGGNYQRIVYSRRASRWYYYASCQKTKKVDCNPHNCDPYECGSTKSGTTDWQDTTNAPSGTTYVSTGDTRILYRYPKTYTVTADYKDGKTVITGTYDYGATYTCPTNNIKKGYTLKSWTKK